MKQHLKLLMLLLQVQPQQIQKLAAEIIAATAATDPEAAAELAATIVAK